MTPAAETAMTPITATLLLRLLLLLLKLSPTERPKIRPISSKTR